MIINILALKSIHQYDVKINKQFCFTRLEKNFLETFEKCSILFKSKAGENFNHRHTLSISKIKI